MIKEFRGKLCNIGEMQKAVKDMLELLVKMSSGEIPNSDYTLDDLTSFCKSLVRSQETIEIENEKGVKTTVGFWCVSETLSMPSDAEVDFLFFPTYIAISILTRFMQQYPDIAKEIPMYEEVLKRGYRGVTLRGLRGHGFEAIADMVRAIEIFDMGGVPGYLSSNPSFSPELLDLLRDIKKFSEEKMKKGIRKNDWSEVPLEKYKLVCDILKDI